MVGDDTYLGVYATNELPSALGPVSRPMAKRKRLWFVWESDDGTFTAQPLNAILKPMAEPKSISFREFESRFTPEPSCTAEPSEGEALHHERRITDRIAVEGASLPDMGPASILRADDPDLLRNWLNAPQQLHLSGQELPSARRVDLARIVEESLDDDLYGQTAYVMPDSQRDNDPHGGTAYAVQRAPLQEHELRSRFAMSLVQIKQGHKQEGEEALEKLISYSDVNPYDGQLVFSEFGLHLRRLGLTRLALKAHLRALEWMPRDERIHFNLARTYHDLNDVPRAIQHLRTALEYAPDFAVASQFLLFLEGTLQA